MIPFSDEIVFVAKCILLATQKYSLLKVLWRRNMIHCDEKFFVAKSTFENLTPKN